MLYSSGPERLFVCLGPGLFSQLAGQPSAKCVLKLAFAFFLIHSFMCLYVCSVHHVCIYIPMYRYMHACAWVYMCMCAWKPEVDIWYLLWSFSALYTETGSITQT